MDRILMATHRTPTIRLGQNPENKSLNAICQTSLCHIRWRSPVLEVWQSWPEVCYIWWYTKRQSPISNFHARELQVGWVAIMAFLRFTLGCSNDLACRFTAPRGHTHGPFHQVTLSMVMILSLECDRWRTVGSGGYHPNRVSINRQTNRVLNIFSKCDGISYWHLFSFSRSGFSSAVWEPLPFALFKQRWTLSRWSGRIPISIMRVWLYVH